MQLMVNTLNKAQQESADTDAEAPNTQMNSAEPPKVDKWCGVVWCGVM